MFELQMESSKQGETEEKRKIFIFCIDCTVVLFYIINSGNTTHKCTLCHDMVAIKKKLWIHALAAPHEA